MPPLAPPAHGEKSSSSGGRQQRQGMAAGPAQQQRSASFHGRGTEQQRHHHPQKQRPKTLPDLLAGVRGASFRSGSPPSPDGDTGSGGRRTPSKVLVSVAVQQSMWPLHVMASAEWTVADLVAAAVALYVKEGRRPLLPSTDPAAFGLHYSQFSLESPEVNTYPHFLDFWPPPLNDKWLPWPIQVYQLKDPYGYGSPLLIVASVNLSFTKFSTSTDSLNPKEKIMELGSRSFFLCPRSSAAAQDASSSSGTANGVIWAASGKTPAWLSYMPFWPTM